MTGKERAVFRAQANTLEPIIQIGKDGISENLIKQVDDTLNARELIKIRIHLETSPKTPRECAQELAGVLSAEIIQVIGGIIVLYRERKEEKTKKAKKSKPAKAKKVRVKGLRERNRVAEEKRNARYGDLTQGKVYSGRSGRPVGNVRERDRKSR